VDFSEVGSLLASGSRDETIRIWNVYTASELAVLPGHQDDVLAVAFNHGSPNAILASGSSDKSIRLWDVEESCNLDHAVSNSAAIRALALSPTGDYLAAVREDKFLRLWKIDASRPGRADSVLSMHGGWDNTIHLWNYQIDHTRQLRGHRGPVLTVKFSPDGTRLASGSWDHTIRLWDLKSWHELDVIEAHKAPVKSVVFHPNGRLLVSGAEDKGIRLRDLSYMDSINLMAGGSAEALQASLPHIAPADTSARIRDFVYLASENFSQRHATHFPFQTAFQSYAYHLAYRLYDGEELVDEPLKFYLHIEDSTQMSFAPHEFLKLRQPRPRDKGPIQWSLENIPDSEQATRSTAMQWISEVVKRMTGQEAK
jgi:WD40 repeat protein